MAAPSPTSFLGRHCFKITSLVLLLGAFFGSTVLFPNVVILGLAYWIAPINPDFAKVALQMVSQNGSNVSSGFFQLCALLLRRLCGIKVSATGVTPGMWGRRKAQVNEAVALADLVKKPPRGKTSVIICNHRTRLDWMLMWVILLDIPGALHALRIVLKGDLAKAPFFGWAMQFFRFIFLARNWTVDKQRLETAARSYRTVGDSTFLLIFPEGTDLHKDAIAKSKKYADDRGLPEYKHVLYPRETGLLALIEALGDGLHEVIDVTLGYEDYDPAGERPGEKSFLQGRMTKKLNALVEVFRFEPLPAGTKASDHSCHYISPKDAEGGSRSEAVRQWLMKQFDRKEEALTSYYSLPRDPKAKLDFDWMHVGYDLKFAVEANTFMTRERGFVRLIPLQHGGLMSHFGVPLMWGFGSIWLLHSAITYGGAAFFVALTIAFYVLETKYRGGVDQWLIFPAAARAADAFEAVVNAAKGKAKPTGRG